MKRGIIVASSLTVILATFSLSTLATLIGERTDSAAAARVFQARLDARVCAACNGAMLRETPALNGSLVRILRAGARLSVLASSNDRTWLRVTSADGYTGWIRAAEVTFDPKLVQQPTQKAVAKTPTKAAPSATPRAASATAAIAQPSPTPETIAAAPTQAPASTSTPAFATFTPTPPQAGTATPPPIAEAQAPHPGLRIPAGMRAVFQRGQKLGNRAGVFSKVGDSLTVATHVLYPFGWGRYSLQSYAGMQDTITFFTTTPARGGDSSFSNVSLTADNGWTTADVLDPARANASICQPGEAPLLCEFRVVKPATALILLGTNDVSKLDAERYRANLTRIVTQSLELGVIPVLTTIPPRMQFEGECTAYNAILASIAATYDVPVSDYATAMRGLPNYGLSSDGVHPSWPDGDPATAADFTPAHLQFGYTMRNLMLVQALDGVRLTLMKP